VPITMSNVFIFLKWRENKSYHYSSELVGAFSFWLDLAALPHLLAQNPAFPNDCTWHAGRVGVAVAAAAGVQRALDSWGVDTSIRIHLQGVNVGPCPKAGDRGVAGG
jgi:hypothetical protein